MPPTRRPVVRRAALLAAVVLHGVLAASAVSVLDGLDDQKTWDWGQFVARAVMFAVVLCATTALQKPAQRFFGPGRPRVQQRQAADRAVRRAVWEGVLPADLDTVAWRQHVDSWVRQAKLFGVFYAVAAVVVAGLVVLTAVRVDAGDRGVLTLAAVLTLSAPVLLVAMRGPVRRARQVRDGRLPVG